MVEYGIIPPSEIELEEAVLGATMLEADAADSLVSTLDADDFYVEANQIIFSAIKTLYKNSFPVDLLTVTKQLRREGNLDRVGGAIYVTRLTNNINSAANLDHHMAIIKEATIARELLAMASMIQSEVRNSGSCDVFAVAERFERSLDEALSGFRRVKIKPITQVAEVAIQAGVKARNNGGKIEGLTLGFSQIDKFMGACQPGDTTVIAGRPGHLKSLVALLAGNYVAEQGYPVLFVSMEMLAVQLGNRFLANRSEVETYKIKEGRWSEDEYEALCHTYKEIQDKKLPLYIYDTPDVNPITLRSVSKQAVRQHGIKLLIVDYMQLMSDKTERSNREQEIARISRSAKKIAMEFGLHVIALSQLGRQVDTNKRVTLSDLRESGSIEQDASNVVFTIRPELWKQDRYFVNNEIGEIETKNAVVLEVAKARDGTLGSGIYKFRGSTMSITEDTYYALPHVPQNVVNPSEPRHNKLDDWT